jgi:hypothetical protein
MTLNVEMLVRATGALGGAQGRGRSSDLGAKFGIPPLRGSREPGLGFIPLDRQAHCATGRADVPALRARGTVVILQV